MCEQVSSGKAAFAVGNARCWAVIKPQVARTSHALAKERAGISDRKAA